VPHYASFAAAPPPIDYVEAITENFLSDARGPARQLELVRARYPVVLHGVGLNLLGHEPLDEAYLDQVCRLADRLDAPFVTDHLCWTRAGGRSHHDLLPVPFVPELVELGAERAAHVQRRLGRPFGLENLSSYVHFKSSTLSEHDFYAATVRSAGCWYLLDVNNIHVSSVNQGFDPQAYLESIEPGRVLQLHLAGHSIEPAGNLIDTHDRAVADEVWALHRQAIQRLGPVPTLLEWDADIPPLAVAVAELEKARRAYA
jgi:uncharacterized protein (UPF0276 family)